MNQENLIILDEFVSNTVKIIPYSSTISVAMETANQLYLRSRWTFSSPPSLILLLIAVPPLAPRVGLGTS